MDRTVPREARRGVRARGAGGGALMKAELGKHLDGQEADEGKWRKEGRRKENT